MEKMLVEASGVNGTGKAARVDGYSVAGKRAPQEKLRMENTLQINTSPHM